MLLASSTQKSGEELKPLMNYHQINRKQNNLRDSKGLTSFKLCRFSLIPQTSAYVKKIYFDTSLNLELKTEKVNLIFLIVILTDIYSINSEKNVIRIYNGNYTT